MTAATVDCSCSDCCRNIVATAAGRNTVVVAATGSGHNIADSDRNINLVIVDRIADLRYFRYSWIYLLS